MANDFYSGNIHIYIGFEHIWTHLIGFHGNIPKLTPSRFTFTYYIFSMLMMITAHCSTVE